MSHAIQPIRALVEKLLTDYVEAFEAKYQHLPVTESDTDWPSACEIDAFGEGTITWQPSKINEALSFDNIEQALELSLHKDIKAFFTCFYSESVDFSCEEGNLSLLFPWSEKDFSRLQENIIGHLLMKQKLKQQETVFFALTDEDDLILSVINDTGEVWVERVGKAPHKKVANSLSEFLATLTPTIY